MEQIKTLEKDIIDKESKRLYWRNWYHKNRSQTEQHKKYAKKYYETHKVEMAKNNKEYYKKRRQNDVNFKLRINLRNRINIALKNGQKGGSAIRDLSCSISELKTHLESKFQPGMTWENYGRGKNKWQIDHIIPLFTFDLTNKVQFLSACHYTNLQPIWHENHLDKTKDDLKNNSVI